jgi:hypothetical protein
VNELETDVTRPNPKTYKIVKHLNKEIQENVSWNIIDKNVWLNHFVELWIQKKRLFNIAQIQTIITETISD